MYVCMLICMYEIYSFNFSFSKFDTGSLFNGIRNFVDNLILTPSM